MAVEQIPGLFLTLTAVLLASALAALGAGSRLGGKLRGAVIAMLAGAALVNIGSLVLLAGDGWKPVLWSRGWIWPRDEVGSLGVGAVFDPLAVLVAVLVAALALLVTAFKPGERSSHRAMAALLLSSACVPVSWAATTPWLAFFGVGGAVLAGFLALGARWESDADSGTASRYLSERGYGMVFALLGACVLGGAAGAGDAGAWPAWKNMLGAALLVAGLVAQIQPFPILGSLLGPSGLSQPWRVLLAQVFPAWAALGALCRLEETLRPIGVQQGLGWFALGSTVLATWSGLCQPEYRSALGFWISSSLSAATAVFAFAGPAVGFPAMICASLGAVSFSMAATVLEEGGRKTAVVTKTVAALAIAAGVGVIGFSSSGAFLSFLGGVWNNPPVSASALIAIFMSSALGWRLFWQVAAIKGGAGGESQGTSWGRVLASAIPMILCLGIFMQGSLSGGTLPVAAGASPNMSGAPDTIWISPLKVLFVGAHSFAAADGADSGVYTTLAAVFFGCLALAMGAGYWSAGRATALRARFPRLSGFVASGYAVETAASRAVGALALAARWSETWLNRFFWNRWVPSALFLLFHRLSRAVNSFDGELRRRAAGLGRRSTEVPSKVLQLVQNGDVQWYLIFGVGSGLALIGHFLRVRG